MKLRSKLIGVVAGMALLSGQVAFAEDASCKKVHLAEVGWSDIAATTGMASVVFEGLGYKPVAPRVTIDVAFLEPKNTGAAMKESIGTFRTIIQGPGSGSAVAA